MDIRIKICGLTREEDALAAAELGADAVGLVFYGGSKRCVDIARAQALVRVLPPFVSTVALFVNESEAAVRRVLEQVPIDIIQFHGDETPEFCRRFAHPYLKAVRVRNGGDAVRAAETFADARAVLLDAYVAGEYGGTGHRFDWSLLPSPLPAAWILSGGLNPENVAAAVRQTGARTLDVSSGVESAPGIKCPQKMRAFIRRARGLED